MSWTPDLISPADGSGTPDCKLGRETWSLREVRERLAVTEESSQMREKEDEVCTLYLVACSLVICLLLSSISFSCCVTSAPGGGVIEPLATDTATALPPLTPASLFAATHHRHSNVASQWKDLSPFTRSSDRSIAQCTVTCIGGAGCVSETTIRCKCCPD